MNGDRGLGTLLLLGNVVGIVLYCWLLFRSGWSLIALQLTGLMAIAGVRVIVAWIGYKLIATPPTYRGFKESWELRNSKALGKVDLKLLSVNFNV